MLSVNLSIPQEIRESDEVHSISDASNWAKALGLEWNTATDQFHVTKYSKFAFIKDGYKTNSRDRYCQSIQY